jgi:hypothetical protein
VLARNVGPKAELVELAGVGHGRDDQIDTMRGFPAG